MDMMRLFTFARSSVTVCCPLFRNASLRYGLLRVGHKRKFTRFFCRFGRYEGRSVVKRHCPG